MMPHAVWELGRDAELFEDSSVSNPLVAALLRAALRYRICLFSIAFIITFFIKTSLGPSKIL